SDVTATIRCAVFFPILSRSHFSTTRYVAIVSAVAPDLATTTTRVLLGFIESSAASINDGSTLSRITSFGFFVEKAGCTGCGPRIAQSSAQEQSALPPIPNRQPAPYPPRNLPA